MKILETTYNFDDSKVRVSEEISNAIRNMEINIKFQESRLQQIKGELTGKLGNQITSPFLTHFFIQVPDHISTPEFNPSQRDVVHYAILTEP